MTDDQTPKLHEYADWMTEDVAQRLYAARQDLADVLGLRPEDETEIDAVRDRLMAIIRSLHETACVLRGHDAASLPVDRIERLAERVERDCLDAEVLMARGLSLIARPPCAPAATPLAPRRAVRGDGPFSEVSALRRSPGRRSVLGLG